MSHLNMNSPSTQICTCHQLLHPQVLQLLIKLFETEHSQLDVMEQVCVYQCEINASHFTFQQKSVCCDCVTASADNMLVLFPLSAGVEEDSAGPNGSSAESWLRPARSWLYSKVSGKAQHGYLPH